MPIELLLFLILNQLTQPKVAYYQEEQRLKPIRLNENRYKPRNSRHRVKTSRGIRNTN